MSEPRKTKRQMAREQTLRERNFLFLHPTATLNDIQMFRRAGLLEEQREGRLPIYRFCQVIRDSAPTDHIAQVRYAQRVCRTLKAVTK